MQSLLKVQSFMILVVIRLGNAAPASPQVDPVGNECSNHQTVLDASTKDGTVLTDLASFRFPGTPDDFSISFYSYNEKEYYIKNSTKYRCNQQPYDDERKFLCIKGRSKVKIRRHSLFSLVPNGTKISVVVTLHSRNEPLGLGACTLNYFKGYRAQSTTAKVTKAPTTTTSAKTTTTTTTTTTTNAATTQATTQTTKRIEETTVRETTRHIETIRSTESSPSNTPIETTFHSTNPKFSTTKPSVPSLTKTLEPCWEENNLRNELLACKPKIIEIFTPLVNGFKYWLNVSMEDSPFVKISHIFVRTFGSTIAKNTKLEVKIYASNGERKILLKDVKLKIKTEVTILDVNSVIPRNSTYLTVKMQKGDLDIAGPPHIVSMFVSTYGFCSKPGCLKNYDTWMTNFSRQPCVDKSHPAPSSKVDPVASFSSCFEACNPETTKIPSSNNVYLWPWTLADTTAMVACQNGKGNATRACIRQKKKSSKWGPVDDKACKAVNAKRSEELEGLTNVPINATNASKKAKKLKTLTTDDPSTLPPGQISKVTDILEQLSAFASDQEVANEMLETVDNIMEASEESLREGQQSNNVSQRMVNVLSTVCGALLTNKTEFSLAKKGFALAGARESKSGFKGITISYKSGSSINSSSGISLERGSTQQPKETTAAISLPKSLILAQKNDLSKMLFVAYDHGKLFQEVGPSRLNSKVISAEVSGVKISGLSEPVVTKYKTSNDSSDLASLCAWWDFSQSRWSTSGCSLHSYQNGYVTCHCNHLTNFAVLLGAKTPVKDSAHHLALKIISYVGVAISLVGATFTLISYIIFPKLRENDPPKILMNLCAALILLEVLFLAGIERTSPRAGCQTVAFLLHYALLCVLSWSAVEGFFSYRGIVMPMKSEIQNLMFRASIFGWGVPVIFPVIGIAAWTNEYGDAQSCAVKGMPLYATLIVPVGLVMVVNFASIVSIMVALHKSSKMYPHNAISALHRLRIIAAFILLFSLTWLFGFLVVANGIIAFQYIFCILNSLQGFFIFVFYGLKNENVRKSWTDKLGLVHKRKHAQSTSAGTKKTDSSFDSVTYNKTDSLSSGHRNGNGTIDSETKVQLTSRANVYATSL